MIRATEIAEWLQVSPKDILSVEAVAGGSLNNAYRVSLPSKNVFIKYHPSPVEGQFETEAAGLRLLADTHTVHVPQVLAVGRHYLVLDWIPVDRRHETEAAERLGRQLALLHQQPVSGFGLPVGNVIGVRQAPGWDTPNGLEFYRQARLLPLIQALDHQGRLDTGRLARLEQLVERLDRWIDPRRSIPSLLHGDLWAGNWLAAGTTPYLIDPAVLHGDRESEMAMTELFGGFPDAFYAGYQATWPLDADYPDRRPLYQLYHLLVHLYLFGESYGPAIDRILRRYLG